MGKSNKFDYTNRSNSGAKLGQIIGSALQKEAEKVKKDADRHAQKARKQSADSISGTADSSAFTTHIIDLKAPNKDLGDDGVCALVDGLEIALKDGTAVASLALEDLNLSGNSMTTASLARLAPIIQLARFDFKTLNLSRNKIQVETDEQANQWEVFLRAFKHCFKLRRLDLSNNPKLGTKALEIFARVHTLEPLISPVHPGGEKSVLSLVSEDHETGSPHETGQSLDMEASGEFSPTMANAQFIKRRQGLRSIPYITLHNVGLDDTGALWLSYLLQDHHYPNQLMDELNATNAESLIKTYQQDTNSRGVDWTENKAIGKDGTHLLSKTEALRRQLMLDDRATLASPGFGDEADAGFADDEQSRRQSLDPTHSRAVQGNRRVSLRSIRTEDGGEHEATELESARKRIQRHIIAYDGGKSVELWSAALKAFRASRMLLYVSPSKRKYYTGEPRFQMPGSEVQEAKVTVQPPSPADSPIAESPPHLTIDTSKAAKLAPTDKASYASKLAATSGSRTGSPESALTEVTNTPTTPLRLQKPIHRKGAFGEADATDSETLTEKLSTLMIRDRSPERFVRYQQIRNAKEDRSFRDVSRASHLPPDLVECIIRLTLTRREREALSEVQMQAAIERGQRRETLMVEREWLKKDESAQVWMLLDSIDCLAYGE